MEKENKPLREKIKDCPAGSGIGLFREDDVKQAVKEAYEEIENKSNFKNNSGLVFLGDIKKIFKDKFGFEL